MQNQILFYIVFLSQVLLISFYFPRTVLGRIRHVVQTYPPSSYPRLYPVPIEAVERAQRNYRIMNVLVLAAGLVLVFVGFYSPSEEMLNWDSDSVLTAYFFLQYSPLIIAGTAGLTYLKLMRKADSRTTRKAELQPRRLFDFVSPALIGLAIFVYGAFVVFILYVRQFEFPWFGGYSNIVAITGGNLLFAGAIAHSLYGKKKDPYQAYEDRIRQIGVAIRTLVWVSIFATTFVAISIALAAFELRHLNPLATSLYLQVIALISFRSFRIDDVDFDVYKADPLVDADEPGAPFVLRDSDGVRI